MKTTGGSEQADHTGIENKTDLVCIGRAGMDLFSEQMGRGLFFVQSESGREIIQSFRAYLGGTPANVAFGAARLGLRVAILSRVSSDPIGMFVKRTLESGGVDTSGIRIDDRRKTALTILGLNPPCEFPRVFYRDNSADSHLQREDVDTPTLRKSRAIFVTGAGLASPHLTEATRFAIDTAKQNGALVVLDVDYRRVFWTTAAEPSRHGIDEKRRASSAIRDVIEAVDIVIGNAEEIRIVGDEGDTDKSILRIRSMSDAVIVVTRGGHGSSLYQKGERPIHTTAYQATVLNPLGAGDAFAAGFLYRWLRNPDNVDPVDCMKYGNAAGALVVAQHACAQAMPRARELDLVVNSFVTSVLRSGKIPVAVEGCSPIQPEEEE